MTAIGNTAWANGSSRRRSKCAHEDMANGPFPSDRARIINPAVPTVQYPQGSDDWGDKSVSVEGPLVERK